MKIITGLQMLAVYYFFHDRCGSVSGQWFEDETRHFEYMQLDLVHRGSFNDTDCMRDLLNCWEIVKPDIICSHWVHYESVCGVMRHDCTDRQGLAFREIVPIYESLCIETERT